MPRAKLPYRTTLANFHLPHTLAEEIHAFHLSSGKPKVKIAIEAFTAYLEADKGKSLMRAGITDENGVVKPELDGDL